MARELAKKYFEDGFTTNEILHLLKDSHGLNVSKRTVERLLSTQGLWRRKNKTDVAEVAAFIERQLETSGQYHGYRWMYQKCWQNKIVIDRETVRILLRLLDHQGVDLRSRNRLRRRVYYSRGPNWVWHIDGYDKIKPFGIGISGCIDGFSRKLVWLEAYKTNNDPKIIAGYFMDAVIDAGGCPARVRLDLGTENGHVAELQRFLHYPANQVTDPVSLGPSTGNQRIERWWLTLRSECVQFWIDFFDKLREDGHFLDNFLDKALIQFCFLKPIQDELNQVAVTWNNHRIRQVNNSRSPHGRPSILYAVPHLYGGRDYLHPVSMEKASLCLEECSFKDFPCDEDVFKICVDLMSEHGLSFSNDVYQTLDIYIRLRELISNELQR